MNEIKIPVEKIKSNRDSDAICVCNFLYIFKIENRDSMHYICRTENIPASITVSLDHQNIYKNCGEKSVRKKLKENGQDDVEALDNTVAYIHC